MINLVAEMCFDQVFQDQCGETKGLQIDDEKEVFFF